MVFTNHINVLVNLFVAIALVGIGVFTFGKDVLFDRFFFISLLLVAYLCRKEVNALSVIAIILVCRLIDEAAFSLLEPNTLISKLLIYAVCGVILFRLKFDWIGTVSLMFLLLCICVDIMWWWIGYQGFAIYWYMIAILLDSIIRYCMVYRVFWLEKLLPNRSENLIADELFSILAAIKILISISVVFEDFVERKFDVLINLAYPFYPYASHAFSIVVLWGIFNQMLIVRFRSTVDA